MTRAFEEEVISPEIPQSFEMPAYLPHMMLSHLRLSQPKSVPALANEMRIPVSVTKNIVGYLLQQGSAAIYAQGVVKLPRAKDGRGIGR